MRLWESQSDGVLTHQAYEEIGGLCGSITSWCDQVINGLPEPIARAVLTMLVRPADPVHHIPAVRRQRRLADLREAAEDAGEVLAGLIDGRVIVTSVPEPASEAVADLAHDALIDRWDALRAWVKQDADCQKWLLRAEERQQLWTNRNDPADLLSGCDLTEGREWSTRRRLPHDVANLLTTSQDHHHARTRRARRLNIVLAGLLAVVVVVAGVAG